MNGKSENFYRSWSELNGTKRKRSIQMEKEKEKANARKDNLKLDLKRKSIQGKRESKELFKGRKG